nr:vacuolar protein sorting associated protein 8 [Hymenolepis microstoma]
MSEYMPDVYAGASSIFSDGSDLASDIEADLQELPIEEDFDSTAFSLPSASPFTDSLSSLHSSDISDDALFNHSTTLKPSHQQQQCCQNYIRSASLRSVHTQLLNASLKLNCGSPSCISLQSFIVVGTNNGFLFAFDRHQKLICSIDTSITDVSSGQGAITSISQNLLSTRLLTGFASGRIAMWQLPKVSGGTDSDNDDEKCFDEEFTQTHSKNDLKSKKVNSSSFTLLRIIDDVHQQGQSIIVCAFTSMPTVAVSVDSSGSAYEMDFRRGILGRSTFSSCFFSGSHGEICAIAPLRPTHTLGLLQNYHRQPAFRALIGSAIVAMASFTKVIVVALKPKFRVIFWQHLKGSPSCLPQLTWSWCFSESQNSGEGTAYLGFARTSTLYISRITTRPLTSSDEVPSGAHVFTIGGHQFMHRIQLIRSISVEQRIVSMHFFTLEHIAFLDTEEILRVYDLSVEQEVESLNLSTTQICYNSTAFKAVVIGGKVSEALACASERACANSLASSGGKLLVFGKNAITLVSLKPWTERAINLFKTGRVEEALNSCCQVLKEQSPSSVKESLLQVLTQLPLAHAKRRPTPLAVSMLVEICVTADLQDFLQSSVIPVYRQDPLSYPLLLRSMCQRLLTLPPIYASTDPTNINDCYLRCLTPDVTKEMLTWCVRGPIIDLPESAHVKSSSSLTDKSLSTTSLSISALRKSSTQRMENGRRLAESCLFRLSPISLDIDKVLKFCLSNGLYQGFIYIYAFVLKDHETAFRWLTDILITRAHSLDESKISVSTTRSTSVHSNSSSTDSLSNLNTTEAVNAILLFLRSSFAGEEIFNIPLESPFYPDVPNKVFNLLLSSQVISPEDHEKSILSQSATMATCTAPRLRVLLHFGGTTDLLNMFTLVLRDSEFFASKQPSSTAPSCHLRQRLITTLLACALDEPGQGMFPIEVGDLIRLLCFICEQILRPENMEITFQSQKIIAVLQFIARRFDICTETDLPWLDLSDVLHRLLKAQKLEASPELLKVAESISLCDFCEHVYLRQGNMVAVLSCLLTGLYRVASTRPIRNSIQAQDLVSRIFVFLNNCLTSEQTGSNFGPLVNRFLQSVEIYSYCDPLRCLFLLIRSLGPSMRRIIYILDALFMSDGQIQSSSFDLQAYQPLADDKPGFSAEGPHHPAAIYILRPFYELMHSEMPEADREHAVARVNGDTSLRVLLDELVSKIDPLVAELYFRLLLASSNVEDPSIQENRHSLCNFLRVNSEYRAPILLELLDEKSHPQEMACIYEKIGDREKAMELLKKHFLEHWKSLVKSCDHSSAKNPTVPEELMTIAQTLFDFAARQCISKRSSENEPPWFIIIDTLSDLREENLSEQLTLRLNFLFHKLLESASPYVPTPALINRVLQLSDKSVSNFGSETNKFLLQLVGAWHKEVNLMQDCHRLMTSDISSSEQVLVSALKRGVGMRRYSCALCGLGFALRYRRMRSTVTRNLYTGGFTTVSERNPSSLEIMVLWCGHGVHVDCYEIYCERLKTRMSGAQSGDKKYVCLQCNNFIDSSAPPPLFDRSGCRGNSISTPLIPPQHLLDAFDEIEISQPYHSCKLSQSSQQKIVNQSRPQKSINPFENDD